MLRDVVRFFPHLAKRNFQQMVKTILPKAEEPNPSVAITSMEILGQLVWAGDRDEVRPMLPSFMAVVIDILEKHTSKGKRLAALELLGNTARATGYVIQPYLDHPKLIFLLHNILVHEHDQDLCREAVKVIGILGAIDPQRTTPEARNSADPSAPPTTVVFDPSDEEYNQRVAFHALMEILKDSALSSQHTFVVDAVMFIFRSMRQNCVSYLSMVIPTIVATLRTAPPEQIEFYFQSLGQLVSITGVYVRHYLNILIPLITDFWESLETRAIVAGFIESLARALASHIRSHTSRLLTLLLSACDGDSKDPRQHKIVLTVLRALPAFACNLKGLCHLVVPVLINIFSRKQTSTEIRAAALHCVSQLADAQVDLSEYLSGVGSSSHTVIPPLIIL
ncbi:ARM repeat-containing protein [Atractiella rhizophila]|nr:ARM repeat-containing protein [Atractiella rhizophila]